MLQKTFRSRFTTCSVLIIGSFYTIALLYRFRFAAFYNRIIEKYSTYGSFYGASFAVGPLSPQDVDGEEELTSVYLRVFFKVVLVPCVASLCCLGVAEKNHEKRGTPILRYTGFLLMPFLVQSLTTSFVYFSGLRGSFLYRRMDEKLRSINRELREISQSQKSRFERMTRHCEISDLIDDLARCYEGLNDSINEQMDLHRFLMGVTILFYVVNILHRMFLQYMLISQAAKASVFYDAETILITVSHITIGVLELILMVDVTDSCHNGSLRVGKTVQRLIYHRDLDIRLRQSVEIFSVQVLHTRVQVDLCGLSPLGFPLLLGIFNAVCSYLVIMIQFYIKRGG